MAAPRFGLQLQTVYAELLERLRLDEEEGLSAHEGFFSKRRQGSRTYWYFRRRVSGNAYSEEYLGPETPELLAEIDRRGVQVASAREAGALRREMVRSLASAGYPRTDPRTGRVLDELARAGVFRSGAVLVGTLAFRCYPGLLGVRLDRGLMQTQDIDLARGAAVPIAVDRPMEPRFVEALRRAEPFLPVPSIRRGGQSTRWRTRDRDLSVELLTPLIGRARAAPVELPGIGAHADPIRFLDYLLTEPVPAAVLVRSGVLVRVPLPERYAVHKLLVSQKRAAHQRAKAAKDVAQAEAMLAVLVDERPDDLADAWADLVGRGPGWSRPAQKALRKLPTDVQAALDQRRG